MKVVICGAMFHTDLKKNCNSPPADRLFSKPKCLIVKLVSYISGFRISDLNRIFCIVSNMKILTFKLNGSTAILSLCMHRDTSG